MFSNTSPHLKYPAQAASGETAKAKSSYSGDLSWALVRPTWKDDLLVLGFISFLYPPSGLQSMFKRYNFPRILAPRLFIVELMTITSSKRRREKKKKQLSTITNQKNLRMHVLPFGKRPPGAGSSDGTWKIGKWGCPPGELRAQAGCEAGAARGLASAVTAGGAEG